MQLTDSTQAVAARYDYDSWGVTQTNSGSYSSQPYRWSTKEQDAVTGFYYYGFRFYSPSLRTWINRDPIGEEGGLNLYASFDNDPVNKLDEYGEQSALLGSATRVVGGRLLGYYYAYRALQTLGNDIGVRGDGYMRQKWPERYKEAKPSKSSKKEDSTEYPSWVNEEAFLPVSTDTGPHVWAKRILEKKYPNDPKKREPGPKSDYNQIIKSCDRGGNKPWKAFKAKGSS